MTAATGRPHTLRTNLLADPLGIDTPIPRFSWRLPADVSGQSSYRIEVSAYDDQIIWDSGDVPSAAQFDVAYGGPALRSFSLYSWRISSTSGSWSETARFETAALDGDALSAAWITSDLENDGSGRPLYFRSCFSIDVVEAARPRAYVAALGWYRFFVNGADVTDGALVGRWSPYDVFVDYQTYDLAPYIRSGDNNVLIVVGDGRFRGRLGALERRARYGDKLACFAHLFSDASTMTTWLATDASWTVGYGPILSSDPKRGEAVDLRLGDSGRTSDEHPEGSCPAMLLPDHPRRLRAEDTARIIPVLELSPRRVWRSPSGRQLVDFGQNAVGHARISLPPSPAGQEITLSYSEALGTDGELARGYLAPGKRSYDQQDSVLSGGQAAAVEPWFTTHGFRYVEVDGVDDDLSSDSAVAIVRTTPLREFAQFTCSDPRLEKLHDNVLWSMRSNFTDVPTDCPTRERSGWTGDIQVFGPTASILCDAQAFLRRYLRLVASEQLPNGSIPPFVPSECSSFTGGLNGLVRGSASSVGWGDVAVMLPWTLYEYYGDEVVLEEQYESMTRWVDFLARLAARKTGRGRWLSRRVGADEKYIIGAGFHFGEWFRPGEGFPQLVRDMTLLNPAIPTAYLAHSSQLVAKTAQILGKTADADRYAQLSGAVTSAWRRAFVRDDGRISRDRQDDYVRALAFNLLTPTAVPAAVDRLVELVDQADGHLDTGFLSTGLLLPVLAENGRADVAYRLLLQDTCPSWLYQVERGATTIWETWEGHKRDGQPDKSHNHYAFGTVARWLHEGVAGLSPAEPGYRRIRIAPRLGAGLSHASSSIHTPFGPASSSWTVQDDSVTLDVTVPPGTTADVHVPGEDTVRSVGPGHHQLASRSFLIATSSRTPGAGR